MALTKAGTNENTKAGAEIGPTDDDIAENAALAMILEVSSFPKPGNVHRLRDFKDTAYEQFLASAVAAGTVFGRAAKAARTHEYGAGAMIEAAVERSIRRQSGGNTHFGTFVLLIPLVMGAAAVSETERKTASDPENITASDPENIAERIAGAAGKICRKTTACDAEAFYRAFAASGAAVQKDPEGTFDLTDPAAVSRIADSGKTLAALMEEAAGRDLVAAEWVNGFEKTKAFRKRLARHEEYMAHRTAHGTVHRNISESNRDPVAKSRICTAVVVTFAEFLASVPDTFIASKHDQKAADDVCAKAAAILEECGFDPAGKETAYDEDAVIRLCKRLDVLDDEMHRNGHNPGSLADICAAGLFLYLAGGRRL